jgi:hypothetical protein
MAMSVVFGADESLDRPLRDGESAPPLLSPFALRPYSAEHPSLLYFEVKILDGDVHGWDDAPGSTGYLSIGITRADLPVQMLPGVDHRSLALVAMVGQECNVHCGSLTDDYGIPALSVGDVVGCAVNQERGFTFFTWNGHRGNSLYVDPRPMPYATVGVANRTRCIESLAINFGDAPFVYQHSAENEAADGEPPQAEEDEDEDKGEDEHEEEQQGAVNGGESDAQGGDAEQ